MTGIAHRRRHHARNRATSWAPSFRKAARDSRRPGRGCRGPGSFLGHAPPEARVRASNTERRCFNLGCEFRSGDLGRLSDRAFSQHGEAIVTTRRRSEHRIAPCSRYDEPPTGYSSRVARQQSPLRFTLSAILQVCPDSCQRLTIRLTRHRGFRDGYPLYHIPEKSCREARMRLPLRCQLRQCNPQRGRKPRRAA